MAPEKNTVEEAEKTVEIAVKKKPASGAKKKASSEKKPPKKTSLPVRVVGKKVSSKDRVEEDILEVKGEKEVKHSEGKGENREFFKRSAKKTEKEERKKKEKEEKDSKEKEKKDSRPQPKSIGLYRKISFFFIALTVLLLGSIFYFYFVSLTIEVIPKKERKSDKVSFTVSGQSNGQEPSFGKGSVDGAVEQIPVKEEGKFLATGAEILGREIIGKAVIYNNKGDKQVLIATTRLMSPEGKVYRIKERVEIPPNGSKEVEIYTDEPSEEMAIGPTRFTLPALWAGLQDKVYAESKTAFSYNTQVKKYIQQIDIDKGLQDLKASLVDKVSRQFGDNYKGFDKVIFEIDKNSLQVNPSAKANDSVEDFIISLSAKVNVVAFKRADAEQLAREKFLSKAPPEKKVIGLEASETKYNLSSTDFATGQAVVEASFVGFQSARKGDALVEREKLIGLNESQISDYLTNSDNFSDFKIKFSPSFMKKAPALVDRIKIIIKD